MIAIEELAVVHGGRTLFADATVQFNPGNRYGLVGANGSGKSTLLRILSGDEEPTRGSVGRPNAVRVGHLRQDHYASDDERIIDVVLAGRERLWGALSERDQLLAGEIGEAEGVRLAELEEVILEEDGYSAEGEAGAILEGLGIPSERHYEELKVLSGGFKLRVLLGQLLFSAPEVLLLDEPTNHLDIVSIRWLEQHLIASPATVLVASHDQDFLDVVCTHIVDIDYEAMTCYTGNFTRFLEQKQADRDAKEHQIAKQERRRDELDRFVTRFKAKASKARQAQSKAKLMAKMEADIVDLPRSSRRHPSFEFQTVRHSGATPLKVVGIGKAFDDNIVLDDVSFELDRGDRVAIIGPNGIGKSTLLKILVNELKADEGSFTWGYETHIAYFPQDHQAVVSGAHNAESWLWQWEPGAMIGKVRGLLARALFSKDEAEKKVGILSGGEACRLLLAKLMLIDHNVLVLDEPTNHLDLEAIHQLGEALAKYPGTILFVSHNRHFVGQVATRIIDIDRDGIHDYRGSYAEYLEDVGRDWLIRSGGAQAASDKQSMRVGVEKASKADGRQSKAQRKLRKKVERLERDVERLEAAVEEGQQALVALPADQQAEGFAQQQALQRELEEKMGAWEAASAELEAYDA